MLPRPFEPADLPFVLALNNSESEAVNALTLEQLEAFVGSAYAAFSVDAPPGAFLLAFSHRTPRQGPNHGWFLEREPTFAYVDRLVVAPQLRGRGLGRALYGALERVASVDGLSTLCCEVNLEPLNAASLAFHDSLGFVAAGEGVDPRNGKRVRYLVRRVAGPSQG